MSIRTAQVVRKLNQDGSVSVLKLPHPDSTVIEGVCWGRYDDMFTPAFWVTRLWIDEDPNDSSEQPNYRLGASLEEEIVACMLGGYGMPAEVGLAAFNRFKQQGLIRYDVTEMELQSALTEPLAIGDRRIRYRYPRQKAQFIAAALNRLENESAPLHDEIAFRDWLITFKGIGPKTASWITRNRLQSDRVAILDVHLHRAGLLIGLFEPSDNLDKHYRRMEEKLVQFASALGVKLSELDDLVWRYMKELNHLAIEILEERQSADRAA